MPINMACPSCGKTLAAPDTAAGKRAKCPACGQIMIVPAVQSGEQSDSPPPPPSGPQPPPEPTESWLNELSAASQSAEASAATSPVDDSGGEGRRPCPECGEMIMAGAAKCRFCGAIFDPHLKAQARTRTTGGDDENLNAVDWVICVVPICCIGLIVGIVYAIQGKPKGMKMVGISIAAIVVWNVLSFIVRLSIVPNGFH